jgi:polyhydroxyalkanoate synthesis regulator phasin
MQTNENPQISFEEVKELYKDMLRERAKEKYRIWDREYKKMRYEIDPEFREKQKQQAKERRERIKAIAPSVTTS